MIQHLDLSSVDWSRGQFALTAIYHWIFVPLTLGLAFIVAIMESIYVKTGNPEWKKITKFWMTLFGINFAIGVATGIILEFEFGTNWSNYSWFVGDIFGAPLAIEGIMAFFLESTFVAVMFFGWNKTSKKFHLTATWLTAIGANLSALWILVANAWMQYPVGMRFNPDTARNEMMNFWSVLFSPIAITKFLHTVTSAYALAAIFVIGISAWFLLKKRETSFAKKSMLVAGVFGLLSIIFVIWNGDRSAYQIAQKQPMKLAAMENLYEGKKPSGMVVIGITTTDKKYNDNKNDFIVKIEIPKLLSFLSFRRVDAYVPGVKDLIEGNNEYGIISAKEKIERGKFAINTLKEYKEAKKANDTAKTKLLAMKFDENTTVGQEFLNNNFRYFGYGYLNSPDQLIPNIPFTFYSFRIMVGLGFYFLVFFILVVIFTYKNKIENKKGFLWLAIITIPLAYLASEAGWIVAEIGRQPWAIQNLLPNIAAASRIDATSVQITFFLFLVLFTALLIAELKILTRQIKLGPKDGGTK